MNTEENKHPDNAAGEEHKQPDKASGEAYVPRPAWQVWAARLGVVLAVLFVIAQILTIAGGGN